MNNNIQAVLFDWIYWNTNQARECLKPKKIQPIKGVHTADKYHCYRLSVIINITTMTTLSKEVIII